VQRICEYTWEDDENNAKHRQHRCENLYGHRGAHECGVQYRDVDGFLVFCGAQQ
jgi:hypothetical protein